MIEQGILSVILLLLFYAFGILFKKIFPFIPELNSIILLGGVLSVSFIATLSAFFIPLNLYFEIGLVTIAIIISIIHSNQVKSFLFTFKIIDKRFYLICILGLIVTVTYPFILDHFGYYIPTVKWLDFNGYQKGISNFEWVLAQNSAWHILQASLNETLDYTYRLNFILFIIYNLYVIEKKEYKLMIFNPLFLFFINSPSPDLPIFVFSIVLINEYFQSSKNQSFYFLISAFLVLIKAIAIILPLFFLVELIRNNRNLMDKNCIGVLGLMLIFFAKNIITAANPIFPFGFGNLTFLEWSSPDIMYQVSTQYGKLIPLKENYTIEEIHQMDFVTYYKNVLFSLTLRTLLLSSTLIFSLIILILSFINHSFKKFRILLFVMIIKSIIIIMASAQFRFLLDVLVLDILILLIVWSSKKLNFYWNYVGIFLSIFTVITFNIIGNYKINGNSIATISFIQPFKIENFLKVSNYEKLVSRKEIIDNLEFNYPENYPLIYNGDIPTLGATSLNEILYRYQFYPQLINENDLKKGFKSKKLDELQKEIILEILKHKKSE